MFTFSLSDSLACEQMTAQFPVFEKIFEWIRRNPDPEDGEYPIDGKQLFVRAVTVTTTSERSGVFEAHREYADVHYCISGGEVIGHMPKISLKPKGEYDPEHDVKLFYKPPEDQYKRVTMTPGRFEFFIPGEVHMPLIFDNEHAMVRKLVFKIQKKLLGS